MYENQLARVVFFLTPSFQTPGHLLGIKTCVHALQTTTWPYLISRSNRTYDIKLQRNSHLDGPLRIHPDPQVLNCSLLPYLLWSGLTRDGVGPKNVPWPASIKALPNLPAGSECFLGFLRAPIYRARGIIYTHMLFAASKIYRLKSFLATMTVLATASFLNHLKSLYPRKDSSSLNNPWYIIASVAFCASNRTEEVPRVFQYALKDLQAEDESVNNCRLLARKMRDALFKAGMVGGYARTINGLVALHEVMPEELCDTKTMRRTDTSIEGYERTGEALFRSIYGETADSVQNLLDTIYPDMGWFSNTIAYGITYGFIDILSPLETSYTLVAALIASDSPRQIQWHLDGARRRGATFEEIQAVRTMSMEVAALAGIKWRAGVPEVKDMFISQNKQ